MWPKEKTIDDAVVIGEQEGGLYKLKGHPEQALVHDTVEPNELWHRRLSHVHYRALPIASKVVEGLPEIQAKHDGVYKGCAKGNNTKKTFLSSESKEKGILEIIHFDVCSLMSSSLGRIDRFRSSLDFTKSKEDSNLYYKVEDGNPMMLLLYVYDLFVIGMDGLIANSYQIY